MKKHLAEQSRLWDYQILSNLGKGEYGQVFQVEHKKTKQLFALKKMSISSSHEKQKIQAFKQIKCLKLLSHPSIIQYRESFLSMDNIYIVMQYASKGDFNQIIEQRKKKQKYFKEEELWDLFQQIVKGVKYLHEKGIIHRDIKCENIFCMDNNKPKIGDLGMSKILLNPDDLISTRVGTPIYFAPEIIQNQMYSYPVDIWALGCVFYNLIMLQHPFLEAGISTLSYYIIDKEPKPIKGHYSPQLIEIVKQCLTKDPKKRINVFDLALRIKNRNTYQPKNKISIFNIKQLALFTHSPLEDLISNRLKCEKREKDSPKKYSQLFSQIKSFYKNSKQFSRRYRGHTNSIILKSDINNAQSPKNSQRCCSTATSPRKRHLNDSFALKPNKLDFNHETRQNSKELTNRIKSIGFSQSLLQKKQKTNFQILQNQSQISPEKNDKQQKLKGRKSFL